VPHNMEDQSDSDDSPRFFHTVRPGERAEDPKRGVSFAVAGEDDAGERTPAKPSAVEKRSVQPRRDTYSGVVRTKFRLEASGFGLSQSLISSDTLQKPSGDSLSARVAQARVHIPAAKERKTGVTVRASSKSPDGIVMRQPASPLLRRRSMSTKVGFFFGCSGCCFSPVSPLCCFDALSNASRRDTSGRDLPPFVRLLMTHLSSIPYAMD
jgi:hypothetical protein